MVHKHRIPIRAPYRLDLTVSVLRRLSTNVVDLFTPDGQYVRALLGSSGPVIVRAAELPNEDCLSIDIESDGEDDGALLALVCQMLGADRDLTDFNRSALQILWLAPLVTRMSGVKPPRYPTLWEACANAIVFQQVSLRAASAIMQRLVLALGLPVEVAGLPKPCLIFPSADSIQSATDDLLRATGLSTGKIATLRRMAEALACGILDESKLETLPSPDAAAALCRIKGIGPWTSAVILLRGLGRLDVFPANDTSVASNLALVAGTAPLDTQAVLHALGPQRGMLYFYLLLARLEARGEIALPSYANPLTNPLEFQSWRGSSLRP